MNVLIVEDELSWQEILKEYVGVALISIGSSEDDIYVASNFQEAKQAIEESGPWNLLVADITLDQSRQILGQNFGRALIARAYEYKIPTIVVSGTITVSDASNFLRRYEVIDCFSKEDFAAFETTFVSDIKDVFLSSPEDDTVASREYSVSSRTFSALNNGYILSIGISDYSDISPLKKTTNDARAIYSTLLVKGYSEKNSCLLLNQNATKTAISESLNWLAEAATFNDTVVIFFSGHGLRRIGGFNPGEYLCPFDISLDRLEETCISNQEFTNALNSINAGRLVVFLDSCHSGGVGETKSTRSITKPGLSEDSYNSFATSSSVKGQGRVIIASCRPNEFSWELPEMSNGLFTNYLLEGLREGAVRLDGKVPIMRLFEYVYDKVPQHRNQHPFIKATSENFIVAYSNISESSSPS